MVEQEQLYELRILSGLHRGATLPMEPRSHLIGASEDADVVLVDHGIAERHAALTMDSEGWSLTAMDGEVRGAETDAPAGQHGLAAGEFARVGRVWLTVVEQDAPWEDPPPEPLPLAAPAQPEAQVDGYADEMLSVDELLGGDDDRAGQPAEAAAAEAAEAAEAAAAQAAAPQQPEPPPQLRPARKARKILLPIAVGAILSVGAAAYAITTRPADVDAKTVARAALAHAPAALAPKPLSQEALRQALRQRLSEVDLLRRFNLTLNDNAWSLQAALDEEEAARFRRMLDGFMQANHITFPVEVKLGNPDSMLPFKIQQVISGANASVVTDDGQRLYPGDEYRGVKLTAIDGNRLTFAGRQPIEVKW